MMTTTTGTPTTTTSAATDPPKNVLIIGDSNTRHLDPKMLHHEKQVVIETKSTLDKAISEIQSIPDPGNVSNVVIMSGLNDLRSEKVQVSDVVHKMPAEPTTGNSQMQQFTWEVSRQQMINASITINN